jgi:hypothetical protein
MRIAHLPLQEDGLRWSADSKNIPDVLLALSKLDRPVDQKSGGGGDGKSAGSSGAISREQFIVENKGSSGSLGRRALEGLMGGRRASAKDSRPHRDENNINNLPLDPRYVDALQGGSEDLTIAAKSDTKVAERKP